MTQQTRFARAAASVAVVGVLASAFAIAAWAAARTNRFDVKKNVPHYTGKPQEAPAPWAHVVRAGASFREPGADKQVLAAVEEFLRECEGFLKERGFSQPLDIPAAADRGDLPEIYVGHPEGFWAPTDVLSDEDRQLYGRHVVLISLSDPPSRWNRQIAAPLAKQPAAYVLYVTLELSDYAVAQKNWKGHKAVELGTGYKLPLPWLTSLDQLVEVLQFKGALYRADGKFVRAGAEAFHAQRTPFRQAILNVQRSMQAAEVAGALHSKRADLGGEPLAWQVALQNLVAQLSGRADLLVVPPE